MDPAPWIRYQKKHNIHVVGSFENVHGERYVIWRIENGDTLYFTGDEVDWEPRNRLWPTEFMFNEDERAKIAKLLWRTIGEMPPADVTYSPELEERPDMIALRKERNRPTLSWDARRPVGS